MDISSKLLYEISSQNKNEVQIAWALGNLVVKNFIHIVTSNIYGLKYLSICRSANYEVSICTSNQINSSAKIYRSTVLIYTLGNHSKWPEPRPFDKYLAIKVSTLLAMNNMVAKTKTQALNLMHYSLSLFL